MNVFSGAGPFHENLILDASHVEGIRPRGGIERYAGIVRIHGMGPCLEGAMGIRRPVKDRPPGEDP